MENSRLIIFTFIINNNNYMQAIQVFEVFTSITPFHDLSVGLIIGGKNLKFEQTHISTMNVLICTPGRLLQHMEGIYLSDLNFKYDYINRYFQMYY